jgi:penicillin-binding protein 2
MALVTATVANGGTVYHPRLVDRIESPDPNLQPHALRFPKGKKRGQLIVRPENLAIIRDAMRADVADDDGTGKRARIEGYEVCGKTGTAEVRSPSEGRYKITWFVSFAPFENPRYAVVVMVERGVSGGRTCAPAARKIYEALIERDKKTGLARN